MQQALQTSVLKAWLYGTSIFTASEVGWNVGWIFTAILDLREKKTFQMSLPGI
jgi:hypothetical protein